MPRGHPGKDGDEYTAKNGYRYRRVGEEWRLLHHIIAEEKIGRKVDSNVERVCFEDGNRSNLDPKNIVVKRKRGGKNIRVESLKTQIRKRFEELFELDEVEAAKLHNELW